MAFFNKKEEVIDIELTQYGKHVLSKGKFMPYYYAFFDNGILYDSQYGGIEEEPADAQDRILSTPVRKTQYVFTSLEKQVKELTKLIRTGNINIQDQEIQNYKDREYALPTPLGNSAIGSSKAPAWSIAFLKGNLKNSESSITSAQSVVKIPQINLEPIIYKTRVLIDSQDNQEKSVFTVDLAEQNFSLSAAPHTQGLDESGSPLSNSLLDELFSDGSYLNVKNDLLLMSIEEHSVEIDNENFEMEVFLVEDVDEQGKVITKQEAQTTPTREKLYPLSFINRKKNIVNDILLDDEEIGREQFSASFVWDDVDPSYVEYWLDIQIDHEVDRELVCAFLSNYRNQEQNVFSKEDLAKEYGCPDRILTTDVNISRKQIERVDQLPIMEKKSKGEDC